MDRPKASLTRRDFLYRTAAVGGAALVTNTMNAWGMGIASSVAAPPALSGSGKGKRVAVIGAGVAGLSAAFELNKLGYQVQVLEARPYAGGRCQSARKGFSLTELGGETQHCRFDPGHYINHGPWRIPLEHQSTLYYTRLFDVPLEVMVNENDHAFVYLEDGGPLSGRRLRGAQLKADMRGHVAELLAKSVQGRRLDGALTPDDQTLLLDYLAREGALARDDLAYRGRNGRGYAVNPGAGLVPGAGTPSDPLAFRDLLAARVGKVYSAVQDFPMHATRFFGSAQPNLPARAVMQVAALSNPGWLVEIEVVAAKK